MNTRKLLLPSLLLLLLQVTASAELRQGQSTTAAEKTRNKTSLIDQDAEKITVRADKRLLLEHHSPYLRAHAQDPIDWFTLNHDRLEELLQDNRLQQKRSLVISSGYQSCYWCFRMKIDSFSDTSLAQLINDHFIPIIIDRDQQPRLDAHLQEFITEQRGFGGWPLTLILTPDGDPVLGFGYTSPETIRSTLSSYLERWNSMPDRVRQLAAASADERKKDRKRQAALLEQTSPGLLLKQLLSQVSAAADETHGGFGTQPKFPHLPHLTALLDLYSLNPDPNLRRFLVKTLDAMLAGALHDAIGGGFFRYSDLADWREPHFEQMLYTQAMMISLLVRSAQTFSAPRYAFAANRALNNLTDRFAREDGYFHASIAAFDESSGEKKQQTKTALRPGSYYLWQADELDRLLGQHWRQKINNLMGDEPQHYDKPILPAFGQSSSNSREKNILLEARQKRPPPPVDDKLIPAWQGLTLSALSYAIALQPSSPEQRQNPNRNAAEINSGNNRHNSRSPVATARRLADNLLKLAETSGANATHKQDKLVLKTFSDYVYVARGLFDWWQASAEPRYLLQVKRLLISAHRLFYRGDQWHEGDTPGFLDPGGQPAIADSQLPSASAVWFSLADTMVLLDREISASAIEADTKDLSSAVTQMASRLPLAVSDNALYHTTLITALVARQIRLNRQQRSTHRPIDPARNNLHAP